MKYYLIEISTGDEKVAGKSVYEYESRNDAVAAFHTKLGQAMKSDLFETELLIVVDSAGGWCEQQYYNANENR